MAAGLPDIVDCARLARDGAVLRRTYELGELPRLRGMLAAPEGAVDAGFEFVVLPSGRPGAAVTVQAAPQLVCQRCLKDFGFPVCGGSDIEFAAPADAESAADDREVVVMHDGQVSLRELAEEELLLAVPIAPACAQPQSCGKAPVPLSGEDIAGGQGDMRRPFRVLQDLLKKT